MKAPLEMKDKFEKAIIEAEELSKKFLSGDLFPDKEYIIERDLQKTTIDTHTAWRKLWFRRNRYSFYTVTSAAVIILLVSVLLFIPGNTILEDESSLISGLLPVNGSVTLKLSSGRIVELQSDSLMTDTVSGLILENKKSTITYKLIDGDSNTDKPEIPDVSVISEKNHDREIGYNELAIPKGRSYSLQLSDGTKIWLNALSKIRYPVRFGKQERRVYITGEAYFEVAKNDKVPFIVETSFYDVKVIGTKFNVNAYSDEKKVTTTLLEGLISIPSVDGTDNIIEPGKQYQFDKVSKKTLIESVNTGLFVSWINNNLMMDQMRLEDIFRVLSRRYDIDVFFKEDEIKNETFSGMVPLNDYLNVILDQISKVSNAEFQIEGKLIVVRSK